MGGCQPNRIAIILERFKMAPGLCDIRRHHQKFSAGHRLLIDQIMVQCQCEKMLGNVAEVKARDGIIIAITSEGCPKVDELADHCIQVPKTLELFSPILFVVPLQLLAYHIAVLKGTDVDQPRNLAKSVTVE